MLPLHTVVLKANKGEFDALRNLDERTIRSVQPLFEVGRVTDTILERKYMASSATPTMTHLNRVLDAMSVAWPNRVAMVDGYQWPANARTESGEHVIAYMVSRLRAAGNSVIPVIGYDRWGNPDYQLGLKSIIPREDGRYCLRLDSAAFDDVAEPEYLRSSVTDIVDELDLIPAQCSVLLDFADVSIDIMSVETLVSKASDIIRELRGFGFHHYIIAGCSIPKTIDLAVSKRDTVGWVLRKEMLAWQTLRLEFPDTIILSGDYGVRGPTTTEARSRYTNGKIRHTVKKQVLIARGHPFTDDGSYVQMHELSANITNSAHFLGADYSWGDSQIFLCSRQLTLGGTTRWVAIDTNHHLTFVVQEVEEFERDVVARVSVPSRS